MCAGLSVEREFVWSMLLARCVPSHGCVGVAGAGGVGHRHQGQCAGPMISTESAVLTVENEVTRPMTVHVNVVVDAGVLHAQIYLQ